MKIKTINIFFQILFKNTAQVLMSKLAVDFVKILNELKFKSSSPFIEESLKKMPSRPGHQANLYTLKTKCLGSCTIC